MLSAMKIDHEKHLISNGRMTGPAPSNKMMLWLLLCSLLLHPLFAQTTDIICRILQVDIHSNGTFPEQSFYLCEKYPDMNRDFRLVIDPSSAAMQAYNNRSADQEIYISFPPEYRTEYEGVLTVFINATDNRISVVDKSTLARRSLRGADADMYAVSHQRRNLAKSIGISKALIVMVSTTDATPLKSSDCAKAEFQRASDQFKLCSNNAFNLQLDRLINVTLSKPISRYNYISLFFDASYAVNAYYGFSKFSDPAVNLGIDHVLYYVPKGMYSDNYDFGFSFGAVKGSFTLFQGDMFTESVVMHELGHNLGLHHSRESLSTNPDGDSNEDPEYGDDSSIMGSSFFENIVDEGGRCFGGANNYLLGWYNESTQDLTTTKSGQYRAVPLTSITNARGVTDKQPVIVKIDDYFISFNRKDRFNARTIEYADQVVIVKTMRDGGTDLKGVIVAPGGTGRTRFQDGGIVVEVCSTDFRERMHLVVGRNVGCEALSGECFNSNFEFVTVVNGTSYQRKQCSQVVASECTLLDNPVQTKANPVWKTCPRECPSQSGCGK